MKINSILAATDLSEAADVALAQAISIAQRESATLHICYVEPDPEQLPSGAAVSSLGVHEVAELLAKNHAGHLDELEARVERARLAGVEASGLARSGHADEVVIEAAEELNVDLIVTGTHGRTGIKRFLLGSVAEKIVRSAKTSVLVARREHGALPDAEFRNILVPTDFSKSSERALMLAIRMASPGCTIELFHAWQYPPGTHGVGDPNPKSGPLVTLKNAIVSTNEDLARKWLHKHPVGDITLKFSQAYGAPASLIQDRIAADTYDLVAMGTHGYRGIRRFILGSVAESTVRHAPCSVVVAHGGDIDDND